jgi:hypothetical protein
MLILDLDRPGGFIEVSQQPMIDAAESIAHFPDCGVAVWGRRFSYRLATDILAQSAPNGFAEGSLPIQLVEIRLWASTRAYKAIPGDDGAATSSAFT